MNQGDVIKIKLHGMSQDGRAVGRLESGMTVFVQGGLLGQTVEATITGVKKRLADAVLTKVIEQSPFQVPSACKHSQTCGGCGWMELDYEKQLAEKTLQVQNALVRIGQFKAFNDKWEHKILPIISPYNIENNSDNPNKFLLEYRNKMEFAFSVICSTSKDPDKSCSTKIGLKKRYSHEIVEVSDCKMQAPLSMQIVNAVRAYCNNKDLPFLRYLVIRTPSTEQNTVELITWPLQKNKIHAQSEISAMEDLAKIIMDLPKVQGVLHSVRTQTSDIAYGERLVKTWGNTKLNEKLCLPIWQNQNDDNEASSANPICKTFDLGNKAFFQINTKMTELLYSVVYAFATHVLTEENNVIWDVYGGVGSIGLSLAELAVSNKDSSWSFLSLDKKKMNKLCDVKQEKKKKKADQPFLLEIESVASAIQLAKKNACQYDFCAFETADAKTLKKCFKKYPEPSLIVFDPPRQGVDEQALKALLNNDVPSVIMVSCNPTTLARDLQVLGDKYHICAVQPVDLFPHTPHVEVVVLLTQKK